VPCPSTGWASPCCASTLPSAAEQDRQKLREEAAKQKYNAMAPPVAAYRSEVALANVESALGGASTAAPTGAQQAGLAEKRALIAKTPQELDEEARKKAEQVRLGRAGCG